MRLLVLLVFVFCIYSVGCSSQPPNILEKDTASVNDSNYYDFGQVKAGVVLKHSFVLTNQSPEKLEIEGVNTSCGCTVSRIGKKLLASGESTSLEVEFNTTGYHGVTKQFIYVNTKDADNPVIRFIISAEVLK